MRQSLILAALSVSSFAVAEEAKEPFTGAAELSFLQTTGNTETSSVKGKVDLTYEVEKWRHNAVLEGFGASTEEGTTSERYLFSAGSDYKWTENHFFFSSFRYEDDRFSSYEYQSTLSFGYGNRLVDTKVHRFEFEIGPGFRRSAPIPTALTPDPDVEEEAIVHAGWKYLWNFSESANFIQNTTADSGDENTFIVAETAITSKLTGALALKLSYVIRHNTEVAEGLEKTDAETAVSISYSF